jgi:hypothetical protein
MHYDCHLEVCSLTNAERVDQHLRRWKPSGVVFVQKGADPRSRNEWISRLGLGRGACGVALINCNDLSMGFDRLLAHGTCGALVRLTASDTRARVQDQIQHLHDVLPRTWHIELDMPWDLVGRLAPFFARLDRRFCLAPARSCPHGQEPSVPTILWWFDMGNVYLKLTGPQLDDDIRSMNRLVCRHAPDRVVLGSGQPQAEEGCWWCDEEFISPDQADDNAQRLYPFHLSIPLH